MTAPTDRTRRPACAVLATVLMTAGMLTAAAPTAAWSADAEDSPRGGATETAILAGGCFWGMEDLLRELDGVLDTEVGYAAVEGDRRATPAEAVRIVFDPARISYEALLRFYFRMHDPTTPNRQGNDRGAEYRSAIFVLGDAQRATAERVRAEVDASGFWPKPVVTEISPAGAFEEAAEHHQDYLEKNPGGYTCHWVRGEKGAR
ncbi:MAG: peptide-methionine (S)-S-oxide reductase MsrA [Thermoanaerobaculales bacterium]|jgi:methionine-S-sulfoxide reductase|nr:peptide-methionine (S)-S-oxide reductase MsrA [Thermoanaerobaculales bacterium]